MILVMVYFYQKKAEVDETWNNADEVYRNQSCRNDTVGERVIGISHAGEMSFVLRVQDPLGYKTEASKSNLSKISD